jgi:hypothetical protein
MQTVNAGTARRHYGKPKLINSERAMASARNPPNAGAARGHRGVRMRIQIQARFGSDLGFGVWLVFNPWLLISGVPSRTREMIGMAFQGRCPWLISGVPSGTGGAGCRYIADWGLRSLNRPHPSVVRCHYLPQEKGVCAPRTARSSRAWMGAFGLRSGCGWEVAHSPAPIGIRWASASSTAEGSCCAGRAAGRPGRSRSPFLWRKATPIDVSTTSPAISAR